MGKKRDIKRKKRKRQQRANIEKRNIENIEEIKKEEVHKKKTSKGQHMKEKGTAKREKKQERKPKNKKLIKKVAAIIGLIFLVIIAVLLYLMLRPKFKDITIELGTTDITVYDFLVSDMYQDYAEFVTDIDLLDLTKAQEMDVTLSFRGKEETVKLTIVDTTAPTVEFRDSYQYLDYSIDPEDFILSKEDYSEMTVEIVDEPEFEDYGTYPVTVKVSDIYGNETIGECELVITWLLEEVNIELGSDFSVADIVIDAERFGSLVPESEIEKVDTMTVGTYELYVEVEGKTYTSTVIVEDTTPPELKVKDITIWSDETVSGYKSFIVSTSDISGEVETESSSEIDYSIIGEQKIAIKATDVNGNVTEKTAVLTIKKDTTAPVIYGLSNLTVSKNSTVNYKSGVYAKDNKDGTVSFTVDSSSVKISTAGTYYVTYTAKDSAGNTSTSKRKVTVNWDSEDVDSKVTSFYNSYCKGKSISEIATVVRDKIKYSSTSYSSKNANIYYGLTNGVGNCKVHAYILQALLKKAGYSSKIAYTEDSAHYWNYVNGCHYDSTPGGNHLICCETDEEKLAEPWFACRTYTADQFKYSS